MVLIFMICLGYWLARVAQYGVQDHIYAAVRSSEECKAILNIK